MSNKLLFNLDLPMYLLSIKKKPFEALVNSTKKYEFRRKFTRYTGRIKCFLYVSSPIKAVVGEVIFGEPIIGNVNDMCNLLDHNSSENEKGIRKYFQDCSVCYALPLLEIKVFKESINLSEIRNRFSKSFYPPQSYLILDNPRFVNLKKYLEKKNDS